ncbi:guanylate kinase [Merismopedia glauca]|uniref:Guanylate kinase n=1 Tax=Merismopedia glauca CCAP 1448/3 TaxID=1296344 RepID=A0A2T1C2Y7_9CYAN|nr:guanylate kinase [Merismopedia glauca]PSB02483.1 guanylate kinase [Merismopedia glauca CCAP 1448/3]
MSIGKLIVLTGPSGVGKGTLLKLLLERHSQLYVSISATTRSPRPGEVDGKSYYFVSRPQFAEAIGSGSLLEWAEYAGNYYGTLRHQVEEKIAEGKWVILEIELKGARQIKQSFPSASSIFILPPSLDELEKRIKSRGQDSSEAIALRLATSRLEIAAAKEFDYQIVNENLEVALAEIEAALFTNQATISASENK